MYRSSEKIFAIVAPCRSISYIVSYIIIQKFIIRYNFVSEKKVNKSKRNYSIYYSALRIFVIVKWDSFLLSVVTSHLTEGSNILKKSPLITESRKTASSIILIFYNLPKPHKIVATAPDLFFLFPFILSRGHYNTGIEKQLKFIRPSNDIQMLVENQFNRNQYMRHASSRQNIWIWDHDSWKRHCLAFVFCVFSFQKGNFKFFPGK